MKKTLLVMLALVATVLTGSAQQSDLTTMEDAVYVKAASLPAGSQQTLSVCMKNSIEVQTIQFDLYLPDGLTLVANEDDELMTASKERIPKFNYFQSAMQADGALRLLAQSTSNNIPVGDGEIATVTVRVDATMALGNYPVTVKDIILVSRENVDKKVESVSTTLTVTEPADTRVVLDETSTVMPEAQTGVDVRVRRTINANEWSTIVLPFGMTAEQVRGAFGDDVQLGDFNDYEYDDEAGGITVMFKDATAIEANHPYVIKVSREVTEFTVDGVDVDPQEAVVDFDTSRRKNQPRQMVGTYVAQTELEWGTLFLSGGQFWYSTGLTRMKGFRAYFNFYDLIPDFEDNYESRQVKFRFDDGGTTTGVDNNVQCIMNNVQVYDLQGRAVTTPGKGIYVVKGKKVKR